MPQLRASDLERYLAALGDELALAREEARIIVVGGAALVLRGDILRPTGDVDVLAEVIDGVMLLPRPFSSHLSAAIERVARSFPTELEHAWVNAAVAKDWEQRWPEGLPPGLEAAEWRTYGKWLSVGLAGRETLIPLKMHAVLDRGTVPTFNPSGEVISATVELAGYDRRHLDDLKALAPTDAELETAADWIRTQDGGDINILLQAVINQIRAER